MRPWLAICLAAILALPGCTLLDRSPKPVVAPKLKTAVEAVKPEEISGSNARNKARALNDELDHDLDGEL
jgi:hypothetical protein